MPDLFAIFAWERRIQQQKREIRDLREEVETLRAKNQNMREAMRRCLACEYRLEGGGRGRAPDPVADRAVTRDAGQELARQAPNAP
jgi:hypothetical protein